MSVISEILTRAVECRRSGQLQAAQQFCRQVLRLNPQQPVAMQLLGVIADQTSRLEIAIDYIPPAMSLDGESADAFCNECRHPR